MADKQAFDRLSDTGIGFAVDQGGQRYGTPVRIQVGVHAATRVGGQEVVLVFDGKRSISLNKQDALALGLALIRATADPS